MYITICRSLIAICSSLANLFWLGNQLSFNQSTYRVHEHEGTVCPVLVRNVMTAHASDIVIRVSNINYTAIGELCASY